VQRAAELVHDERRERLALDLFRDDEEGRFCLATCSRIGRRSFIDEIFFS
jgi:hypothetical protein